MLYIDATIIIIIPVIVIVICYTGIIITIRRREKRGFIQANSSDTGNTIQCKSYLFIHSDGPSMTKGQSKSSIENKLTTSG